MNKLPFDAAFFSSRLEEVLRLLKEELTNRMLAIPPPPDMDRWDQYILDVNQYYYRSFHEKFFPAYTKIMKAELERLLQLSVQEGSIKKALSANIKRYAQLYNQVKFFLDHVEKDLTLCNSQILPAFRFTGEYQIRFRVLTETWLKNMDVFIREIQTYCALADDQALLAAVDDYTRLMVFEAFLRLDDQDPLCQTGVDEVLIQLEVIKLLLRQQKSCHQATACYEQIYDEIQNAVAALQTVQLPAPVLEILCFYTNKEIMAPLWKFFEKGTKPVWDISALDHLVTVIQKANDSRNRHGQLALTQIRRLKQENHSLLKRFKEIQAFFETWEQISSPWVNTKDSDFLSQCDKSLAFFSDLGNWLKSTDQDLKQVTPVSDLNISWHNFYLETHYLHRQIEDLKDQFQFYYHQQIYYQNMKQDLENAKLFLSNFAADVERLLSPKNLGQMWEDLIINVERVPLRANHPFPAKYCYLLDKYQVETKIIPDFEQPHVLFTNGDLFIIQVDDEVTEVLPLLTIGQKG